jgi:hypothetical protein
VPGDGGGPRAQDVAGAREVVTAGVALYKRAPAKTATRAKK